MSLISNVTHEDNIKLLKKLGISPITIWAQSASIHYIYLSLNATEDHEFWGELLIFK